MNMIKIINYDNDSKIESIMYEQSKIKDVYFCYKKSKIVAEEIKPFLFSDRKEESFYNHLDYGNPWRAKKEDQNRKQYSSHGTCGKWFYYTVDLINSKRYERFVINDNCKNIECCVGMSFECNDNTMYCEDKKLFSCPHCMSWIEREYLFDSGLPKDKNERKLIRDIELNNAIIKSNDILDKMIDIASFKK